MTGTPRHARAGLARTAVALVVAWLVVGGIAQPARHDRALAAAGAAQTTPTTEAAMELQPDADLGPTAPDSVVEFSVVLRQPDGEAARRFLASLHDPASPNYRRYLTPAEFGQQFGPTNDAIDVVVAWLAARGFAIDPAPAQRTALTVRGRVGAVNEAFAVTLHDRLDELSRPYRAPDRDPRIPGPLSTHISAVAALDTRPEEPASVPMLPAIPGGFLDAEMAARAFEIEELHDQGIHGEGQSIGIVSFDTFDDADVAAFDRLTDTAARGGGPPPAVERVRLTGARTEPGGGEGEVNLDIDVIRTIAPRARIINYEGRNGGGFAPIMREIIERGDVDIVSISWGRCERKKDAGTLAADDAEFRAAAAIGISVFVASGDHGAHDCRFFPYPASNPMYRDLGLSLSAPGSEDVILVGGTYLSVGADGTYAEEAGWEDPLIGWATGGGLSEVYERPAWQVGAGVDNEFSTGMRQGPDVAGPADPDSGWFVVYAGPGDDAPGATISGGTSASAPFWAASMLLARQLAEQAGASASGTSQLGALGPLLYQLSASAPAGALFHDVVRGGNLHHNATPGWDYATGLGSPRVGPLARAIVESLR